MFCCLSLLQSNTRVAFSRPSSLIRTPGALDLEYFDQYIVGFGGEITHLKDLNYALSNYFKGVSSTGYSYGLSYTVAHEYLIEDMPVTPPSNVSFHIHKQMVVFLSEVKQFTTYIRNFTNIYIFFYLRLLF